eukprot:scaffold22139_cov146-Isochrysis_galbana.AAC.1
MSPEHEQAEAEARGPRPVGMNVRGFIVHSSHRFFFKMQNLQRGLCLAPCTESLNIRCRCVLQLSPGVLCVYVYVVEIV